MTAQSSQHQAVQSRTSQAQSPPATSPHARSALARSTPTRASEVLAPRAPAPEAGAEAEPGSGPEGDPQERHPGHGFWGSRGAELARVTAIDLAVLAGHLLLYPTGILPERVPGPPPAREPADGELPAGPAALSAEGRGHPPVLLLHGFVDNRSAFALLRRSLLRHGWTRVEALNYSPLTCDIRAAAELLGPHIEQACERSGHHQVDIVGHSLGGLIARYYVQCLGGHSRVRTLVTLGTPHSGTRAVPALVPHPLARQMRPGSAVLEKLAGPAPECRTRFVAFWSDLDQLMMPVRSARLEHPDLLTQNIKVSGIGHLALPVHGTVAAEIRRALAGEGPRRDSMDTA
jgi:pimeloyl-ACP methyl ester carboxylesterase